MSKPKSKPMTYGRLEEVLTNLNFVRLDGGDFIAYNNARYKALIVLPVTRPEEMLSTWHYLATRKNIVEKRIASADLLEQRLKEPIRRTPIVRKTRVSSVA